MNDEKGEPMSKQTEELRRRIEDLPLSEMDLKVFMREWSKYESLVSQLVMETPSGDRRNDLSDLSLILARLGYVLHLVWTLKQTGPQVLARAEKADSLEKELRVTALDVIEARLEVDALIRAADKHEWEEGVSLEEERDIAWDKRANWGMCPSQTNDPVKVAADYLKEKCGADVQREETS